MIVYAKPAGSESSRAGIGDERAVAGRPVPAVAVAAAVAVAVARESGLGAEEPVEAPAERDAEARR